MSSSRHLKLIPPAPPLPAPKRILVSDAALRKLDLGADYTMGRICDAERVCKDDDVVFIEVRIDALETELAKLKKELNK